MIYFNFRYKMQVYYLTSKTHFFMSWRLIWNCINFIFWSVNCVAMPFVIPSTKSYCAKYLLLPFSLILNFIREIYPTNHKVFMFFQKHRAFECYNIPGFWILRMYLTKSFLEKLLHLEISRLNQVRRVTDLPSKVQMEIAK